MSTPENDKRGHLWQLLFGKDNLPLDEKSPSASVTQKSADDPQGMLRPNVDLGKPADVPLLIPTDSHELKQESALEWIETTPITIKNPGNLGNFLLKYFAARALAERIGNCTLHGFELPCSDCKFPEADGNRFKKTILVRSTNDFDVSYLATIARTEKSVHIVLDDYLQRQSFFLDVEKYRTELPVRSDDIPIIGDEEILINIRAGDILAGHVPFYPLTPISFYRDIVRSTGLRPVFLGQLEDGLYVRALHEEFPDGRFIPSLGPIRDFDTIRRAIYIVPAISTFSVVAAWLSEARTIYFQLNGFLNPSILRECNLVPTEDQRYRFFLFPAYLALPEAKALEQHKRLAGMWHEISRNQLRLILTSSPFLARPDFGGALNPPPGFDERWYLHTYLDAAWSISEGWYGDALHHYLDIGRQRGYLPGPEIRIMPYPNVALGQRAWQSSISHWSIGKTNNEDAMRAVNGNRQKEYAFCTDKETNPWWVVDLGGAYNIQEIHVYNRLGPEVSRVRAIPLVIYSSSDNSTWSELFRTHEDDIFGADAWPAIPLMCRPRVPTRARYVKVLAEKKDTFLHLAEVEVYATP